MLGSWFPLLSLLALSPVSLAAPSFENTAIVRTVELGGSLVHVTTTYAAKALSNNVRSYTIALPKDEAERTSFMEAKVKGSQKPLTLEVQSSNVNEHFDLIKLDLPKTLSAESTVNLVFETVQAHATRPWPEKAGQADTQALKFNTSLFVISPYDTLVQRTKVRTPTPRIISYTTPQDVSDFTFEEPVTKSGATITYGPYNNVAASASNEFLSTQQQSVEVHYGYDHPVVEVIDYKRHAEVSHWGANLNIEDNIHLQNTGPELKGHFSRLEHQSQTHFKRTAPHVVSGMALHLPPGIRNAYYYDIIGNVSTSRLKQTPSVPKTARGSHFSLFEMQPRYPLLGGWNYTFTLGWDSPLADYAAWDNSQGRYILEVPLMTYIPGSVYRKAEINIVLPEGATDITIHPTYPAISTEKFTHVTYLDTVGRPAVTLKYQDLTDKHALGNVFVTYRVPFTAHLRKPITVTAAFMLLFSLALAARRTNLQIHKKKIL